MIGSTSFLTEEEIKSLGFKKYGDNLKISRFAHFYTPSIVVFATSYCSIVCE